MGAEGGVIVVPGKSWEELEEFRSLIGPLIRYFNDSDWKDSDYEYMNSYTGAAIFCCWNSWSYDCPNLESIFKSPISLVNYPDEWTFKDYVEHLLTLGYWEIINCSEYELLLIKHCTQKDLLIYEGQTMFTPTEEMVFRASELFEWRLKDWEKAAKKWSKRIYSEETWT